MTWSPQISTESYISNSGKSFWEKCVFIEDKNEYQCLVEQCIYYKDNRYYQGIYALKSALIYKKLFSNILYCKKTNELVSIRIVKDCIDERSILSRLDKEDRDELPKLRGK